MINNCIISVQYFKKYFFTFILYNFKLTMLFFHRFINLRSSLTVSSIVSTITLTILLFIKRQLIKYRNIYDLKWIFWNKFLIFFMHLSEKDTMPVLVNERWPSDRCHWGWHFVSSFRSIKFAKIFVNDLKFFLINNKYVSTIIISSW